MTVSSLPSLGLCLEVLTPQAQAVVHVIREVGTACAAFHDRVVRDLGAECVQADEVWSF